MQDEQSTPAGDAGVKTALISRLNFQNPAFGGTRIQLLGTLGPGRRMGKTGRISRGHERIASLHPFDRQRQSTSAKRRRRKTISVSSVLPSRWAEPEAYRRKNEREGGGGMSGKVGGVFFANCRHGIQGQPCTSGFIEKVISGWKEIEVEAVRDAI
jgi:hypothetical protein